MGSVITILLVAVAGLLVVAAALMIFSPVDIALDTARGEMRVRWLLALEFARPLPGRKGETRLKFAGMPIPLPTPEKKAKREKPKRKRRAFGQFFLRCATNSGIREVFFRQFRKVWKQMLRSAEVTRHRVRVSLPDPAVNGMLYGVAQWTGASRWDFEANFTGETSLLLEIRLRPRRILKAILVFLAGLPYRAMRKEWREAKLTTAHGMT